ncbi:MAG: four helix bundle protein [Gemmatimonadales bacterium]
MSSPSFPVQSFKDLLVWQRAMDLAVRVHEITVAMPARHRFSLAEQMNRAAVSIPSNIAEGAGRRHRGEYRYHVGIARGSVAELETQLLLGVRVEAIPASHAAEPLRLADEVSRMLLGLARRLSKPAP